MTYLVHGGVPLSLGGLEKVTFELCDAVTEPKIVVLDCSGENLVELASLPPFVPPVSTLCDMLGTGLCFSNSPGS